MKYKSLAALLIGLMLLTSCSGCLAAPGRPGPGGGRPGKQEEQDDKYRNETDSEREERLEAELKAEAKADRIAKMLREAVGKIKDYHLNSVCSFGPKFRDISRKLTEEWYMFTPIDLSEDGVQTFELISGNMYIIGEVTVTVKNGTFQVDYMYYGSGIDVNDEYFTIFPDFDSVTTEDLEKPKKRFDYGRAYDIDFRLDGDTDVLLFVCNTVTFRRGAGGVYTYYEDHPDYVSAVQEMTDSIGKTALEPMK